MKLKVYFLGFLMIFLLVFFSCDLDDDDLCKCADDPNNCICVNCECVTTFEIKVFKLTNIERTNNGLSPLIWHNTLALAAHGHSMDMMLNNFMSHTGSDESNVGQRIERAGITNWKNWAENVAAGYTTPEAVVAGWMNSPGHRANILNTNVTHLGVGYVPRPQGSTADYATYWTQKFCAFF